MERSCVALTCAKGGEKRTVLEKILKNSKYWPTVGLSACRPKVWPADDLENFRTCQGSFY